MGGDIGINVGVKSISFEEQIGSKKYFLVLDSSTSQCLTSASKSSRHSRPCSPNSGWKLHVGF